MTGQTNDKESFLLVNLSYQISVHHLCQNLNPGVWSVTVKVFVVVPERTKLSLTSGVVGDSFLALFSSGSVLIACEDNSSQ